MSYREATFLSVPTVVFGLVEYMAYLGLNSMGQTMAMEPFDAAVARKYSILTSAFWGGLPIAVLLVMTSLFFWYRALTERQMNNSRGAN